jgi:UDP-glucuronate decarboxylase
MYNHRMKILVTGGAGFLGSHLSRSLIESGHSVIAMDNLYTGARKNISELEKHPRFEFIRHDVTDPIHIEVDGIFNLACPAAPVHYQKNPVQTMKTSVIGAANLLDLAHRTGARILQASTSEVYGDPKQSPQEENYWGNVNPIGIRSCYDEGKRAAESMFFDYQRQYKLEIRVARIFNTYGPHMAVNDGRVISNFICQAIQNNDLTIYGDGKQVRSFCYVDDLIEGLIKLFFCDNITEPVNLGNPTPITMAQLACEIISLTKSSSTVTQLRLPQDDPTMREPDISKAKNLLNWEPHTPREQGLLKTISYFRNELSR